MAFKQNAGRGMMPKTGRGIPPTLMSDSPMKQEVEYTRKHSEKVKEYDQKTSTKEGRESYTKGKQTAIDPKTGISAPKPAHHTTKQVGNFMEEYDSKGGFVRREQMNRNSPTGGDKVETMVKNVEKQNKIKSAQASKNANFDNLTGGKKNPTTAKETKTMRDLDRISRT